MGAGEQRHHHRPVHLLRTAALGHAHPFICHCDMAAHYLLGTLNEHGYQCPKDVSIMSFDNTGFTSGTPWLGVNPNHAAINAASQVDDPCSVFSHYRKLIRLRKEYDNITHGDYTLLLPDHPSIFAYERHWEDQVLTVICSFSNAVLEDAAITSLCRGRLLLGNYPAADALHRLRPWEARVYLSEC